MQLLLLIRMFSGLVWMCSMVNNSWNIKHLISTDRICPTKFESIGSNTSVRRQVLLIRARIRLHV